MSSLETIYEKLAPGIDTASLMTPLTPTKPPETRQMSREVAHELNNILTIIRGYADRLVLKHGDNPALRPELQLIADNARRAANVVRAASQAQAQPPLPR